MDPQLLDRIDARTNEVGFDAASDAGVGDLLTVLAAGKPGGRILELGTGTGRGTACLLRGMDADARLVTVENDPALAAVARAELDDPRVEWVVADGGAWLGTAEGPFDLVFADTWPGKFSHLDVALSLVAPGGFYVVDDLRPQPNWPDGHQVVVDHLVALLRTRPGWRTAFLDGPSGVLVCVHHFD